MHGQTPPRFPHRAAASAVTRTKVIEAAARLFNARHYDEVGFREVAKAIGMSPGAVTAHFPTKIELWEACAGGYKMPTPADWAAAVDALDHLESSSEYNTDVHRTARRIVAKASGQ